MKSLLVLVFIATLKCGNAIEPGVLSYWNPFSADSEQYSNLAASGIAIIKPFSKDDITKINSSEIDKFKSIVDAVKNARPGVKLLGYVLAGAGGGYKGRQPNKGIQAQMEVYHDKFPWIKGIFFDRIGKMCQSAQIDFQDLRNIFQTVYTNGTIAWNPGWVDDNKCSFNSTKPGEIVLNFEGDKNKYLDKATESHLREAQAIASDNHVATWHVVHSTSSNRNDLEQLFNIIHDRFADYAFITDRNGKLNPYLHPPSYWDQEVAKFKQ